MKILFTNFLGLALSVMVLASCSQVATYEQADMTPEEVAFAAKNGFNLTPYGTGGNENAALLACSAGCITERVLFEDNTSTRIGNSSNYKNVNYQIWNTATQLIVQTTSNRATDKVEIIVNGVTYTNDPALDVPAGELLFTYFELPEGYDPCEYTLTSVKHFGGGPQVTLSTINYGVYEYCTACVESFSYVDEGDSQAYVFSYTPSESVTGANLVFTFAQGTAESATGLDDWSVEGVTRQITMDLVACKTYTWTVDLTPDCSGKSPNSNVWTDFKVNDISKRNSGTPTIVESCSQ